MEVGGDPLRVGLDDDHRRAGRVQGPEKPEVLVGGRDHLVSGPQVEAREHDVASVGRRRGQRDPLGRNADEFRDGTA